MSWRVAAGRLAAVAGVATALAAALQRTDAGENETMVTLALLATAGAALGLAPAVSPRRAAAGMLCAASLIVSSNDGVLLSTLTRDLAAAAGPLVVTFGAVALMNGRVTTAVAATGGVAATVIWLLVYDPFLDPGCKGCGTVAFTVWAQSDVAHGLRVGGLAVVAAAGWWEVLMRHFAPVGVAVVATVLAADLSGHSQRHQLLVLCAGYVAVVLAHRCATTWRRRTAVQRLLVAYGQGRGLSDTLREAVGDQDLRVTFPNTDGSAFIDALGNPARPDPAQSTTDLRVYDECIARVHHSPQVRLPDLDAALEPAAAVMLDNERLTAQLAARVAERDAERRAVVRVGLDARNRLERDLHDSVQQELLALGLDIRLALGSLDDDSPERTSLQRALDLVHDAVERVRVISSGVAPPLLATKGLSAAVTALARRNAAPIEVGELPTTRLAADIEQAGYAVVAEAVARGATAVRAVCRNGVLEVSAAGVAPGSDGVLDDLVAALGGRFHATDGRIEAVIPCAL